MPNPCHARIAGELVSQEEGVQLGLERGDRRWMVGHRRLKMRERLCSRLIGGARRRFCQADQRGADGAPCLEKSPPNPIGRRIAQVAVQVAERLAFVAGVDGLLQESPQALSGEKQASDLIGPPDIESPSATVGSASIATVDSLRPDGLFARMPIIKSSQIPVPNQIPRTFAMGTRHPFQTCQDRFEFLIRLAHMHRSSLAPSLRPTTAIVRKRRLPSSNR